MKTLYFAIIILFASQFSRAQERVTAVINDPDGYTNIRAGKGTSTEIIGKIYDHEVFIYKEKPNEQWLEVAITKCACENHESRYFNEIKGYVHRSRVLDLRKASDQVVKEKLTKVFNHELELSNRVTDLADQFSDEYKTAHNEWAVFHEMMFDEVQDRFSDYICSTRDDELFGLFNRVITMQSGSADELPSMAIGSIFKCLPAWTLQQIPKTQEYFYRLEWGCQGVTDKDHQLKLNEYRKKIGLEQVDYNNYKY